MNDNDWSFDMKHECKSMKGLGWRISFSALSMIIWFAFAVSWLFFLADDYSILQNIGVLLISVLVAGAVNIPVWISFAMKMEEWPEECNRHKRDAVGGIMGVVWAIGVALWLFFYAGDYSLYQNVAVLLLSIVPLAAANMLLKR